MTQAQRVNNSVNKQWRKTVYKLLTDNAPSMTSLLTELLTVAAQAEAQLTNATERTKLRDQSAKVWAAASLGFAGAADLTLGRETKPNAAVILQAFKGGQSCRINYSQKYGAEAYVAKAKHDAGLVLTSV